MTRRFGSATRGVLLCAMLVVGLAEAAESDVFGLWSSGDSLLAVAPTADGGLSMTIVALDDPVYRQDEGRGEPGAQRRDDNNPEVALRQRPLLGLELLSGYRFTGRRWEGHIYDPASGNTYSSRMERQGSQLRMRGYIGVPVLGRTRTFEAVEECIEPVQKMVRVSNVDLVMCD